MAENSSSEDSDDWSLTGEADFSPETLDARSRVAFEAARETLSELSTNLQRAKEEKLRLADRLSQLQAESENCEGPSTAASRVLFDQVQPHLTVADSYIATLTTKIDEARARIAEIRAGAGQLTIPVPSDETAELECGDGRDVKNVPEAVQEEDEEDDPFSGIEEVSVAPNTDGNSGFWNGLLKPILVSGGLVVLLSAGFTLWRTMGVLEVSQANTEKEMVTQLANFTNQVDRLDQNSTKVVERIEKNLQDKIQSMSELASADLETTEAEIREAIAKSQLVVVTRIGETDERFKVTNDRLEKLEKHARFMSSKTEDIQQKMSEILSAINKLTKSVEDRPVAFRSSFGNESSVVVSRLER